MKADSRLDEPVVFLSSVHLLVKPHVRRDGLFKLRRMEVEGSYIPSSCNNVSFFDSDRPFQDEYLSCFVLWKCMHVLNA